MNFLTLDCDPPGIGADTCILCAGNLGNDFVHFRSYEMLLVLRPTNLSTELFM